jgi:hypothetical protein
VKLIVAGSRTVSLNYHLIAGAITFFTGNKTITELVSGGAKGVDSAVPEFLEMDRLDEYPLFNNPPEFKEFPADWDQYGKAAGPIRNKQMAEYADALLLIWDGESKGSANMKKEMQKLKKPIYEVILRTENI